MMSLIKFDCSLVLPGPHPKVHQNQGALSSYPKVPELSSSIFSLLPSRIKVRDIMVLIIASLTIFSQSTLGASL